MSPSTLIGNRQQNQPHLRVVLKTINQKERPRLAPCQGGERGRGQQKPSGPMSRVAWEPVVLGRREKYIRFVSDKNLWSAWGWTFIMKECAVGERNVYIEGLLWSLATSMAQRAPHPEGRSERALGGQQGHEGGKLRPGWRRLAQSHLAAPRIRTQPPSNSAPDRWAHVPTRKPEQRCAQE